MNKELEDIPPWQSNASLRLADIQKRCSELLEDPDELSGLSLEDSVAESDNNDPYSSG